MVNVRPTAAYRRTQMSRVCSLAYELAAKWCWPIFTQRTQSEFSHMALAYRAVDDSTINIVLCIIIISSSSVINQLAVSQFADCMWIHGLVSSRKCLTENLDIIDLNVIFIKFSVIESSNPRIDLPQVGWSTNRLPFCFGLIKANAICCNDIATEGDRATSRPWKWNPTDCLSDTLTHTHRVWQSDVSICRHLPQSSARDRSLTCRSALLSLKLLGGGSKQFFGGRKGRTRVKWSGRKLNKMWSIRNFLPPPLKVHVGFFFKCALITLIYSMRGFTPTHRIRHCCCYHGRSRSSVVAWRLPTIAVYLASHYLANIHRVVVIAGLLQQLLAARHRHAACQ